MIKATLDRASVEEPLKVEAGKTYTPVYVLNAGRLIVSPKPSAGAEVTTDAAVQIDYPGGSTTEYGKASIVLPAGEIKLTVTIGAGVANDSVTLAAGQTLEKEVVVGVGRIVVNALYSEGGDRVDAAGLDTKVFKAKKKIDGSRERLGYSFGPDAKFDLPPGDYVAVVVMDQAMVEGPFAIKDGQSDELTVTLNAGVLAITAPGAKSIKIFAAKKDIQGNRPQFGYGFDGALQTTLTAGNYVVSTDKEDGSAIKETPVTITAGERNELMVE